MTYFMFNKQSCDSMSAVGSRFNHHLCVNTNTCAQSNSLLFDKNNHV